MIILWFLLFAIYFTYAALVIKLIADAWWDVWFGFPLCLFAVFFPAVLVLQFLAYKGLIQ